MKSIAFMIVAAAFTASTALAQTAKPAAAPAKADAKAEAPAPKAPPEPAPLPTNIQIEVRIADQTGNNPAAKKVVTMIASDRQSANIRSSANVAIRIGTGPMAQVINRTVTINVDARPVIVLKEPNKVSVGFGLEYLPKTSNAQEETEPGMTSWSQRLTLTLESGKPMIVSQAADPTSDRKITVEITATILK